METTDNLKEELQEVLGKFNFSIAERDIDDNIISIKVTTNTPVKMEQFESLQAIAQNNDMNYLVKRSGAGISIQFNKI